MFPRVLGHRLEGIVKKAVGTVGVIHDHSKVQVTTSTSKELNVAISHLKESKTFVNMSSLLNPDKALKLFKKMLDEGMATSMDFIQFFLGITIHMLLLVCIT